MKKFSLYKTGILLILLATLNSCQVIGGIFKAGMGFGIILVIAVVVLVIWIIKKMMSK